MKRAIIICEGPTEQSFCNDVLMPYFSQLEIYLEVPTIKKTGGGIVGWEALKYQIEKYLKQDTSAFVTTLIDYYGLYAHHKYPKWDEAERETNRVERMYILEEGMKNNIREDIRNRFIPYIQLHEFESILFSDIGVFDRNFEEEEFLNYEYLVSTINDNPNPELINNGITTAPSKRLENSIKGYKKVIYGALLAHDIGLITIRQKCPHFNNWIEQLEKIK